MMLIRSPEDVADVRAQRGRDARTTPVYTARAAQERRIRDLMQAAGWGRPPVTSSRPDRVPPSSRIDIILELLRHAPDVDLSGPWPWRDATWRDLLAGRRALRAEAALGWAGRGG